MKKLISTKYFYLVVVSIIALALSLIEYIIIVFSTKHSFIPMIIDSFILIGLFLYPAVQNKSKYNLLIVLFIFQWIGSVFAFWLTYNTRGLDLNKHWALLHMNLIFSILMLLVSLFILWFKGKKEDSKDLLDIGFEKTEFLNQSPYFLMVIMTILAFIIATIEVVVLSFTNLGGLIPMSIGAVVFLAVFVYILCKPKRRILYNYLLLLYALIWSVSAFALFYSSVIAWSKGLTFIFPCLLFKGDSIFCSIYINWLFAFIMLITTSLILYLKEKAFFKEKFHKAKIK